jgi:hypothetical protein
MIKGKLASLSIAMRRDGALARATYLCILILSLGQASSAGNNESYVATLIDPAGQLHITTKHKREILPKKDTDQTGFSNARISQDLRAVGWLALYPNCCTSYDVPLKLMVLLNGNMHAFVGSGLVISRWCFWGEGRQVAFEQETVHGGMGVHYELRGIETEALVDKYDPDANPNGITKPPKWVVVLDSNGY